MPEPVKLKPIPGGAEEVIGSLTISFRADGAVRLHTDAMGSTPFPQVCYAAHLLDHLIARMITRQLDEPT